jgi:hypothetical protein
MKASELVCSNCSIKFEQGRSDSDAIEEARVNFPGTPLAELVIVCDDCFHEVMRSAIKKGLRNDYVEIGTNE